VREPVSAADEREDALLLDRDLVRDGEREMMREVGLVGHLEHRVLLARLALVLHHVLKPHHGLPEGERIRGISNTVADAGEAPLLAPSLPTLSQSLRPALGAANHEVPPLSPSARFA
jgi:hypothetical protein